MIHSESIETEGIGDAVVFSAAVNRTPDYNQSGTVNGITYSVRMWFVASAKMAFCSLDAIGTAGDDIDIALPLITSLPDLNGNNTQSLFLNVLEYTAGNNITWLNIMGALVIAKSGALRLYIKKNATLTEGSSDTKWFKLQ